MGGEAGSARLGVDAGSARLFVAVEPPPNVLDLFERLPRPAAPGVRYTRRDQWHVTLRFLGHCRIDDAVAAFRSISAHAADAVAGPAVARLGREVVVVPVAGLDALAAAVIAATHEIGEPPEQRPFTGHVTIARLRQRSAPELLGHPVHAEFRADEIQLVRSHLHPQGARYETLDTVRLDATGR
jgi:RNA 2',3'-cyclic 3'-phosphodiesterase